MLTEHVTALQDSMDYITTHPDDWNQGTWGSVDARSDDTRTGKAFALPGVGCGTSACLAGTGVSRNGYALVARGTVATLCAPVDNLADALRVFDAELPAMGAPSPIGVLLHRRRQVGLTEVPVKARELFGLSDVQAEALFFSENDLVDLWAMAFVFSDGRLTLPAVLPQGFASRDQSVANHVSTRITDWLHGYECGNSYLEEYLDSHSSQFSDALRVLEGAGAGVRA